jgi:hypothetical protein
MVTGFALLLVLFPFLFWYATWFGRKLPDSELDRYIRDAAHPRRQQHALVQLGERMSRGGTAARRWYPDVVKLSSSPVLELRQTAAWIMGQDSTYGPFHEPLLRLLNDRAPMVRRNAALALSNFHDAAARPELLAMLRPYTVPAPAPGAIRYRLKAGEYVNAGTLVAHVGGAEVRSPVPGEVRFLEQRDGSYSPAGQPLLELAPDQNHAWEALRALWSVGAREDLAEVQRYARGVPGMPEKLRQQALLTEQAIQSRAQ